MQMTLLPEDKEDFKLYRTERFEDRHLLYRPGTHPNDAAEQSRKYQLLKCQPAIPSKILDGIAWRTFNGHPLMQWMWRIESFLVVMAVYGICTTI